MLSVPVPVWWRTHLQKIMSVSPGQAGVGKGGVGQDGEKETTKISKWKIYKNSVKFINLSKISVKNRKEDNFNKVFFLLTDVLI